MNRYPDETADPWNLAPPEEPDQTPAILAVYDIRKDMKEFFRTLDRAMLFTRIAYVAALRATAKELQDEAWRMPLGFYGEEGEWARTMGARE